MHVFDSVVVVEMNIFRIDFMILPFPVTLSTFTLSLRNRAVRQRVEGAIVRVELLLLLWSWRGFII